MSRFIFITPPIEIRLEFQQSFKAFSFYEISPFLRVCFTFLHNVFKYSFGREKNYGEN